MGKTVSGEPLGSTVTGDDGAFTFKTLTSASSLLQANYETPASRLESPPVFTRPETSHTGIVLTLPSESSQ